MAKKRADMTPMERMDYIMKGATWDDGEAVGVEMLARCMALHVYARKEGEEYFQQLMKLSVSALTNGLTSQGTLRSSHLLPSATRCRRASISSSRTC